MEAEYEQLCNRVAVINVAVERQIQVKGPDAEKFVDLVITRKASAIKVSLQPYRSSRLFPALSPALLSHCCLMACRLRCAIR